VISLGAPVLSLRLDIARLVRAGLGFVGVIMLDVSVLGCVMHGLAGSN